MITDPLSALSYINSRMPWHRATGAVIFQTTNTAGASVYIARWTYRPGGPSHTCFNWRCLGCGTGEPSATSNECINDQDEVHRRAKAHAAACAAEPQERDL